MANGFPFPYKMRLAVGNFPMDGSKSTHGLGKISGDVRVTLSFRSRHPIEPDAFRFQAGIGQQGSQDGQALGSPVVTGVVVTLADMATQHQHTIRSLLEGAHDKL